MGFGCVKFGRREFITDRSRLTFSSVGCGRLSIYCFAGAECIVKQGCRFRFRGLQGLSALKSGFGCNVCNLALRRDGAAQCLGTHSAAALK